MKTLSIPLPPLKLHYCKTGGKLNQSEIKSVQKYLTAFRNLHLFDKLSGCRELQEMLIFIFQVECFVYIHQDK